MLNFVVAVVLLCLARSQARPTKGTPPFCNGLDCPEYVVKRNGSTYELRCYQSYKWASTVVTGKCLSEHGRSPFIYSALEPFFMFVMPFLVRAQFTPVLVLFQLQELHSQWVACTWAEWSRTRIGLRALFEKEKRKIERSSSFKTGARRLPCGDQLPDLIHSHAMQ